MRRWRLRWKLTLWSALVTGLALITLGVVAAFSVRSEEIEEIDHRLISDAGMLFSRLNAARPGDWDSADLSVEVLKKSGLLFGYAVSTADGEVEHAFPAELATLENQVRPGKFRFRELGSLKLRVAKFSRGNRILLVAADAAPARETVEELLTGYFLALPIVLIVAGLGSWWLAGRALRPIVEITRSAEAITATNLDARLPHPGVEDEIGQHIAVLNAMFDRLQRSFEHASRFTADASHELRTPLTILRGEIEDALRTTRSAADYEQLLVSLLEQTSSLQKIAANLLLLASFDTRKAPLDKTKVELSTLVEEAVEDAELLAGPAELTVAAEIAPNIIIHCDPILIRRVLLNLVDNAVRYNEPSGTVKLELTSDEAMAHFKIANTGRGIPADKHDALFTRFFRIDPDRNSNTGGSGLGLSLCREVISAHGGSIRLVRSDGGWTELEVTLPFAGPQLV